ncbi:MAG: transcriptional regulator [Planctomycetes bacterium]|nr:transcriptional regulator [Planctomycetota bacterium]
MPRPISDVTEAELAVLQVLWDRGTATIRQVTDIAYPQGRASDYGTVQKLLERLREKGHVSRERRDGAPHLFAATLDRDGLIGRSLQTMAEKLCDGSMTPLLTSLVRTERLSAEDRQALRRLVDELDGKGDRS